MLRVPLYNGGAAHTTRGEFGRGGIEGIGAGGAGTSSPQWRGAPEPVNTGCLAALAVQSDSWLKKVLAFHGKRCEGRGAVEGTVQK